MKLDKNQNQTTVEDLEVPGLGNADSFQGIAGKTLPWKYTDGSLVSVPCLRPRPQDSVSTSGEANDKKKKWWRRKSSTSNSSVNDPDDFTMRKVQRGEHLKHYAKDEQGHCIGTEEPAEDCILRGKDSERYRSGKDATFRNEIAGDSADRSALLDVRKETDDGVIRYTSKVEILKFGDDCCEALITSMAIWNDGKGLHSGVNLFVLSGLLPLIL